VLKKELMRTQSKELERAGEYRQVLVQCVHKCAVKHPDVAAGVVHLLMEFLGDSQTVGTLCGTCSEHSSPMRRVAEHCESTA
jgi:coatomer subunit beta